MTTYVEIIARTKSELMTELAELKQWRKERVAAGLKPSKACSPFDSLRWRKLHIAYCLFKGRSLNEIEPNRRPDNKYWHNWVDTQAAKLVEAWKLEAAEDIKAYEDRKALKAGASNAQ